MIHTINIEGINLYAYHGCLDEEAKIGGNYVVDIRMTTDFSEATERDDLDKTIDYCGVFEIVKTEMAIRNKLIETVGARIYKKLKSEFKTILTLHVKITKLLPPIDGDVEKVSIEIQD
jgi:dihydroneopterin aldolase